MADFWLNTATGRRFNFLDPQPDDIDIVDIAVALSHQCRYAGHTRTHYSVALHCLVIEEALERLGENVAVCAWGLLHDAAEAYVTDIPWPLKAAGLVPALAAVEKTIMAAVCARFGLTETEPAIVKDLDLEILDLEASALLRRHADWPKGTPRQPRHDLASAWHYFVDGVAKVSPELSGLKFMRAAHELGLCSRADVGRYEDFTAPRLIGQG